jgi:hypothetical protein
MARLKVETKTGAGVTLEQVQKMGGSAAHPLVIGALATFQRASDEAIEAERVLEQLERNLISSDPLTRARATTQRQAVRLAKLEAEAAAETARTALYAARDAARKDVAPVLEREYLAIIEQVSQPLAVLMAKIEALVQLETLAAQFATAGASIAPAKKACRWSLALEFRRALTQIDQVCSRIITEADRERIA